MNTSIILAASGLSAAKEVPLALTGRPSEINGQPVHYFRKEIARAGHYTYRGDRTEFDITPRRIDAWVENFKARDKNGVKTFCPGEHRTSFNAADNHGFVIDLAREGDSAVATLQLVGDKAAEIAAKNDVSIYITDGSVDAYGNKYGEALEHLALVPNPNQPHLGPFIKIAASADAPARDVPVYELSATTPAPSRKENTMTPELAKQFREKLGIAADVPDDKLPDLAAQKALSLSADSATLAKERDTLKTERDALKTEKETADKQVLALSAFAPIKLDKANLDAHQENVTAKRQIAINSGAITPAEAKLFDDLLGESGQPTLSLSACPGGGRLGMRLWDAVAQLGNNGVRVGNQIPAGAAVATPNPLLRLSTDGREEAEEAMIERARKEGEAYRDQQLKARGLTA
jgi:hypothetical protein